MTGPLHRGDGDGGESIGESWVRGLNEQERAEDPFDPDYWGANPHRDDSGNVEVWFLLAVAGVIVLLALAVVAVWRVMS